MRDESEKDCRQYLSFTLAGGDYAVGILQVKEILQYETITGVPGTPRSIRGVINLRGSVVPVVDLAVKLGLPETPLTRLTCILIVEVELGGARTVLGVIADSVSEVIELGRDDVEGPPAFAAHATMGCVVGMGKVGRRFILLLDVDRVVSADEHDLAGRDSPAPRSEADAP